MDSTITLIFCDLIRLLIHDPLFVGDIYKELAYVNEKYNNNPEILAKLNQASAQE
jgi:hypothetical protein